MRHCFFKGCIGGLLLFFTFLTQADPWFTGPLLAPAGQTVNVGHHNYEQYVFHTENDGIFDRAWKLSHLPQGNSNIINPIYTQGINDDMDLQVGIPYYINHNNGEVGEHLGDLSLFLGYQLIEQKGKLWRPNLRVALQQTFPIGRFDRLQDRFMGTDITGSGSYQTGIAFNFEHLLPLFNNHHYLRTRFSLSYIATFPVTVHGRNVFGGSDQTVGRVHPGDFTGIDLAYEFTITQNWVAVMEAFASIRGASTFSGNPGFDSTGKLATIGSNSQTAISIAPALEYNFSSNVGVIAGVWYSVTGRNSVDFSSFVIALNVYR